MKEVLGENLYNVKEVATMLGITPTSVRAYTHKAKEPLECQTIGGRMYFSEAAIKKFIKAQR